METLKYLTIYRSELASGIVSTALSHGSVRIRTDNLTLASPVVITIHHTDIEVGINPVAIARAYQPL